MNFLSHDTQYTRYMHNHNMYTYCFPAATAVAGAHLNIMLYVRACNTTYEAGRLLAAALNLRHPLTHSDLLFRCHFTHDCVPMFIRVWCMDDKITWLSGLASQRCPPHHPSAETAAPPANPESVPAIRSESWHSKEWPVVKWSQCLVAWCVRVVTNVVI